MSRFWTGARVATGTEMGPGARCLQVQHQTVQQLRLALVHPMTSSVVYLSLRVANTSMFISLRVAMSI